MKRLNFVLFCAVFAISMPTAMVFAQGQAKTPRYTINDVWHVLEEDFKKFKYVTVVKIEKSDESGRLDVDIKRLPYTYGIDRDDQPIPGEKLYINFRTAGSRYNFVLDFNTLETASEQAMPNNPNPRVKVELCSSVRERIYMGIMGQLTPPPDVAQDLRKKAPQTDGASGAAAGASAKTE